MKTGFIARPLLGWELLVEAIPCDKRLSGELASNKRMDIYHEAGRRLNS